MKCRNSRALHSIIVVREREREREKTRQRGKIRCVVRRGSKFKLRLFAFSSGLVHRTVAASFSQHTAQGTKE